MVLKFFFFLPTRRKSAFETAICVECSKMVLEPEIH